jgi:hypothetical protein
MGKRNEYRNSIRSNTEINYDGSNVDDPAIVKRKK